MSRFLQLAELCRGHRIYIQTHNFPDPDAIASAYGLQTLLSLHGVPATLCYDGAVDKLSATKMLDAFHIRMVPYQELRGEMRPEDEILYVDTQKHSGNVTDFIGNEIACIDHHPTFTPAVYQYRDIQMTGACATLIARYFSELGIAPDQDTATALLYGLKMDTLQFARGVTAADIEMFSYLFPFHHAEKLAELERNHMEFQDLKAYGAAIENIEIYGTVGFSCIPFSCPDAMIAILSDFILSLIEVDVSIVFSCRADGIKFSVRSENPEIHAGQLIHRALQGIGDGGGHAVMAGGIIRQEQVHLLGRDPRDAIRNRFLKAHE